MVTTAQRRELEDLAAGINREVEEITAGVRTTLEAASRAGNLLFQAKEIVQSAEAISWKSYCRRYLTVGVRMADNYIRIFEHWDMLEEWMEKNPTKVQALSIHKALTLLAEPRSEARRPRTPTRTVGEKVERLMRRYNITATLQDVMQFLDKIGVTDDQLAALR